MNTLALLAIFVLVSATASTSLVGSAYAQNDPSILLRITTQADEQIVNQLERIYGDSIPSDIQILYQNGHIAVQSLEDSLPDDVDGAQENFLIAMKTFKQITRTLLATPEVSDTPADEDDRDLESELDRLEKYFQNIKTISERHDTGIDLSYIEGLFVQAHDQINFGEFEVAIETIEQLELLIEAIKHEISEHESHSTSDRNKNFALKQLDKIKYTLDEIESVDPGMLELEEANHLVEEIEILISEDNISDVKKRFTELIELVKIIESLSSHTS